MKNLWFLLVLLITTSAFASNIYVAQSIAGGNTGADCADARAMSTLTSTDEAAGNTIHFCGTITSALTITGSGGTLGNPVSFVFESGAMFSAATWGNNSCAINSNNINYLVVDGQTNGVIQATNNGSSPTYTYQNADGGVCLGTSTGSIIRNLTISNLYVRNSSTDTNSGSEGIYLQGNNAQIYSNTIHDVAEGILTDYPAGTTLSGMSIYNNTVYNMNHGIAVGDSGVAAVLSGMLIYGNTIHDAVNWDQPVSDTFHHNGILVFVTNDTSQITGMQIYDNYIYGDMGAYETGHIFMDAEGAGTNGSYNGTLIFNNVLVDNSATNGPANGFIITKANGGTVATGIYNNTMVYTTNVGTNCVMDEGAALTIKNNVMSLCGVVMYVPSGSITASDYNDAYNYTTNQFYGFESLAAWQSASGNDTHTITTTPNLTALFVPNLGSGVIQAGANLRTLSNSNLDVDKAGVARPVAPTLWDIGAYQYAVATTYALTTATNGGLGTGTVTGCAGNYTSGQAFSCTVAAASGSVLTGVSGCGGSGTTTFTGTMPSDACTVTAQFMPVYTTGSFTGTY